jgi:glycosyltransferase involved in cell wall biosynthesis
MQALTVLKNWLYRHPQLLFFASKYSPTIILARPIILLLARLFISRPEKCSVLHISYMIHVPWHMTRILRKYGVHADYLALGTGGPTWDKADYTYKSLIIPFVRPLRELWLFWTLLTRYKAIHFHFGMTPSYDAWEAPALHALGRRVVLHLRGCEARDRERNMMLHPHCNICQDCDYNASGCSNIGSKKRINRVMKVADIVLVTTPDMKDFIPQAMHFPFFPPIEQTLPAHTPKEAGKPFTIVHITNHPGIEGTQLIEDCIQRLKAKGYNLSFRFFRDISHTDALKELSKADMSIGKMKMGYYANAQIESMVLGVPTITWVRPDLMTEALRNSAFIFSSLDDLENTLEYWLDHPEELAARALQARNSILELHNEESLARQLIEYYLPSPLETQ